jgi:hypothetical protein
MHVKQTIILLTIFLFAGTAVSADDCGTKEFKKNADKLDKSKIESVSSLKKLFTESSAGLPRQCLSPLFSEFRSYYYQFMHAYEKSIEDYLSNYPLPRQEESKLASKLSKAGWKLDESEGMYYVGEDGEWFLKEFGSILPEDWNKYLQQRTKEVKNQFSEDAGLLISWEELRDRIIYWEKYLIKYPTFSEKEVIDFYLDVYIRTYLTGMSNSSIADIETNKVQDKITKSYENFLTLNKQSKYYKLVEGQYNILKQNSFLLNEKTSQELEVFYKKNGIKSMVGIQPPTY